MPRLKYKCPICGKVEEIKEDLPIVHLTKTSGCEIKSDVNILCKVCGVNLKTGIEDIKRNPDWAKFNRV